ncbi:BRO domain protein [Lysobacteraceae bacterium NML75-0749]|nr:BRO domain protein [Xanthomonadaceae bacterium NML75-0749]
MNSHIIPFDFEGQAVRVIYDEEGNIWFVAADVCRCLELGNTSMALARLDEDEQALITIEGFTRGNNQVNVINEPGLYSLVLTSRKPEARRFKRWITHDVLPALRKTGHYQMPGHTAPPPERLRPPAWDAPLGSSAESLLAASRSFTAMLRTARHIGLSRQQQLNAANTITFRATGVDVLAEFDVDATGRPMDSDACRVHDYLQGRPRATTVEIAEAMGWIGEYSRSMEMRIARIMRDLGYRQQRHQNPDGSRFREWVMSMAA